MVESARGRGISTPSQTAWALLALLAVGGDEQERAIGRGLAHLTGTLTAEGTWNESAYTATGFPGCGVRQRIPLDDPRLHEKLQRGPDLSRGFMISFNMYRHYFPMIALARARRRALHPGNRPAALLPAGLPQREHPRPPRRRWKSIRARG